MLPGSSLIRDSYLKMCVTVDSGISCVADPREQGAQGCPKMDFDRRNRQLRPERRPDTFLHNFKK